MREPVCMTQQSHTFVYKMVLRLVMATMGMAVANADPCVEPGICVAPQTKYSVVLPVTPRQQWNIEGGFCGAMSVQTAHLAFGAWISQDLVRKANTHGVGHCEPGNGCELEPTNIGQTAQNLKLDYDVFDHSQPKPQAAAYKSWMKAHLVKGHPVVWLVMTKGEDACPYAGACPDGGAFSHIEPVWGIFSDHPLNDTTVYDDDWVLHSSDQDLQHYYRKFSSIVDTTAMDGNCAKAQDGFGKNEMYPCINDQVDYGLAINGINGSGLPTSLAVDSQDEPDTRMGQRAIEMRGTVTVSSLIVGKGYTIYRYTGTEELPTDGSHDTPSAVKLSFTAGNTTHVYEDPIKISSHSATYYRCFESGTHGNHPEV
eukprot:m.142598 g.142598  ORF g.142598 m.142598 type:complete len:369 (-) comp22933_c0_seq1:61-1167(-)